MLLLFIVFVLGAVTVLAVEAVGVVLLIRWLNRRVAREVDKAKPDGDFDFSLHQKQACHFTSLMFMLLNYIMYNWFAESQYGS